MTIKVDKTLVASIALHVLVIGWGLVSFSNKAFELDPEESLPVDIISSDQLARVAAGMKTGKKENPKPLVDEVGEKTLVDDAVGKISKKPPIVTDTAPPPQKAEEKPPEKKPDPPKTVEKKPDPPKPVVQQKTEQKPEPKKPDPAKEDPMAELIKKQEAKKPETKQETKQQEVKKPPVKPETKSAQAPANTSPQKSKQEDALTKIAALLNKQDPTRQAARGDALNSNASLGLAHGKAADNSATWGAFFKEQVNRCWKKPYGGVETQRIEVEFDIKLKKDGTLEAMPVLISRPASEYQRVFMESALRAIIDCAPYNLPQAFFQEWKWFTPVFDSRDVS